MNSAQDTITLYTAQAPIVMDTINKEGVYRVKTAYVDQKYGDEAWIFKQAYSFYAQNAMKYVPAPEGAESGIWVYADEIWVGAQLGNWVLKMEVPKNQVVLFDLRVWNKILNLQYVPENDEDEARYDKRLQDMGIMHPSIAFSSHFYPVVKQEIRESWKRLFGSAKGCPRNYLEAGLWEIRREWVVEARRC